MHSDYDVRNNIVSKATRSQNYSVVDPAGNSLLLSSSMSHNNLRRARKVVVVAGELNFLPFWNFSSKLSSLHASNDDCTHFCYTPDSSSTGAVSIVNPWLSYSIISRYIIYLLSLFCRISIITWSIKELFFKCLLLIH